MTQRRKIRCIAIVVTLVMAFSFVMPAVATPAQLAAPVVTYHTGYPGARWAGRNLTFDAVDGATGYDVYAFKTFDDAMAGENAVAVARNAQFTSPADAATTFIDVRYIEFEELVEGFTRVLPANYTPANPLANPPTTNLRPGFYWYRVRAVNVDNPAVNSELNVVPAPHPDDLLPGSHTRNRNFHTGPIAVGPDEGRAMIEALLANPDKELGVDFRLVDIRGNNAGPDEQLTELLDQGMLRFFDEIMNLTQSASFSYIDDQPGMTPFIEDLVAVFGPNKDAYIIML